MDYVAVPKRKLYNLYLQNNNEVNIMVVKPVCVAVSKRLGHECTCILIPNADTVVIRSQHEQILNDS